MKDQSPNQPTAHQKKVSYFPHVKVYCYARFDYEEPQNIWYSSEEYKTFRKEITNMRQAFEEGCSLKGYCVRGLEVAINSRLKSQRRIRRQHAFSILMDAQMDEALDNESDPDILARRLIGVTSGAQRDAIRRGAQDAQQVYGGQIVDLLNVANTLSVRWEVTSESPSEKCPRKRRPSYPMHQETPPNKCIVQRV